MSALGVLRFVAAHPLNRGRPLAAVWRVLRWQAATRLRPGARTLPFVDDAVLCVARGMTGATGNVYCGLHEYAEMAFLLHWLREDECFLDVGANVGSWTVLAAAVCGARVLALEPDAGARAGLLENVRANGIAGRVELHACAAAAGAGERRFSTGGDTTNHLLPDDADAPSVRVAAATLDALLGARDVALAKIDVEGAEAEVLAGARALLARGQPAALMVEFGGAEAARLLRTLQADGYVACAYEPATRRLQRIDAPRAAGNLLLLRDPDAAQARLAAAPRRRVQATGTWL